METDDLLASVEVYQLQLQQIEGALESAGDDEKSQLQELQANLLQLLELTLQQINTQPKEKERSEEREDRSERSEEKEGSSEEREERSEGSEVKDCSEKNTIDDEFALFQSEIAALSEEQEESRESSEERKEEEPATKYSKEELEKLVGSHCRSPFTERWGGQTYHNAVVLSLVTPEDGQPNLNDPQVRVLFSQPTSLEMLTCRFFMSDRCKYSDEQCRFSHGKNVAASDIKDYREPDYDSVVCGSRVLWLPEDADIWKSATVKDILEDRSAFSVLCDKTKEVEEAKIHQIFPLHCHGDGEEEEEEEKEAEDCKAQEDCESSSEDEAPVFIPSDSWFQNSLSKRLGDWEKHTKGIGSKLMAKMGYIVGTGLGRDGEGRVEPVTAYVYPQGVSLDRCMELREASNGEELLQVEKRLEREKRKEEAKSVQAAERLRKRTSVFDIINTKLGGKGSTTDGENNSDNNSGKTLNVSKNALRTDTNKNLNLKNHQLSENIRILQREVGKIEESQHRQSGNKQALSLITAKLNAKKTELRKLQEAEQKVHGEQQKRRDAKKFSVF